MIRPLRALATLTLIMALAAVTAAPSGAATTRYVPETGASYDYTFSARPPGGLHVVASRRDGSLAFKRGTRTLVVARMCESSSEADPSGLEALRDEAGDARLTRVATGVYRPSRPRGEYWVAVRGGSCLRFARRSGASAALLRAAALRTRAYLGRAGAAGASNRDGIALARRTQRVVKGLDRIVATFAGGECAGAGLSCPRVARPDSVALEGIVDRPGRYFHVRATLPRVGKFALVTRGSSSWVMTEPDNCWSGPVPAAEIDAESLFSDEDFSLSVGSWRLRYGKPQQRPDGTTEISWRGYWNRGVAIVDAEGRVIEGDVVERFAPRVTLSVHGTQAFPQAVDQLSTEPACPQQ